MAAQPSSSQIVWLSGGAGWRLCGAVLALCAVRCAVAAVCRWLLLCLDRLPSNTVAMTQDLIATMLGVRRVGVTEAAGKLQGAGLIDCARGRIKIIDRAGLEAEVCECYKVVKTEIDRLLPKPPALYE